MPRPISIGETGEAWDDMNLVLFLVHPAPPLQLAPPKPPPLVSLLLARLAVAHRAENPSSRSCLLPPPLLVLSMFECTARGGREEELNAVRPQLRRPSGGRAVRVTAALVVAAAAAAAAAASTMSKLRPSPPPPLLLPLQMVRPLMLLTLRMEAEEAVFSEGGMFSAPPAPSALETADSLPAPPPPPPVTKRAALKEDASLEESCRLLAVDEPFPPAPPPGCCGGSALTISLPSRSVKPTVRIS